MKVGTLNNIFSYQKWLPIVRIVSQIGYATSFAMLVVAMIVFSLLRYPKYSLLFAVINGLVFQQFLSPFRKLRNPRNRLHMHLFASFIMRAFMALIRDWVFVDGIRLAVDIVYVDEKNAFIKERNVGMLNIQ